MKKKVVLGSALVLLVALMAWGTWAYFTTEAHVTNVITTGTIKITLNDQINATGATHTADGWQLNGVMPGVEVEKTVSVTNDNADTAGKAWVRVKVDTTVISAMDLDGNGKLDDVIPSAFTLPGDQDGTSRSVAVINYNTTAAGAKWFPHTVTEEDENGQERQVTYYYYKTPLAKGEQTTELFSTVMLNPDLPNEYQAPDQVYKYQGCTVNIAVSAQAVQEKNNNKEGALTELTDATADQVVGWPKN